MHPSTERKMARTNQKPPVSKRPIAAYNREKGWETNKQGKGQEWNLGEEDQTAGKMKKRSGGVSRAGKSCQGQKTVIATNEVLGKRKSRKGSRGRKCINKTSQTGVQ